MKSMLAFFFFVAGTMATMALPTLYNHFEIIFEACLSQLGLTAVICEETGYVEPYACYCSNTSAFTTYMDCFVNGENNDTANVMDFVYLCQAYGSLNLTIESAYQIYEENLPKMKNVLTVKDFNVSIPVNYPVKLDYEEYKITRKFMFVKLLNFNYSIWFGYGLMIFWAFVLVVAAIVNWTIYLFPGLTNLFVGKLSNNWRKYISLTAAFGKKKSDAYRHGWLIPSRMETIIVLAFVILTALFSGLFIVPVKGNLLYPSTIGHVAMFLAIRTGVLVGYVCPLLVLFAGRNNFLQWVTRWNFATFITFHRWVSRVVVLLVIIHAITFTTSDKIKGSYKNHMSVDFVQWGVAAGVAGGIILVQGLLYVRRKSYELFLIIHILMAVCFIVGGYYHTVLFGYGPYYWTSIGIWALDRAIRFSRLIVFGAPKADVTLLAEETLRVVIPKPSYWHAIPGGHAFIHFLRPSCFWQSHPFTFTDSSEEDNFIVMYIKLKGGVTHGVYKRLINSPGKSAKIRVLVEGPYGEASSARKYKNAVFIAGGNGIPGIYSECIDTARKTKEGSGPRLKLMWIIREWKSLAWFYQELRNLNNTHIDTTIFVTKPTLNLTQGMNHLKPILNDSDSSYSVKLERSLVDEKDKDKLLAEEFDTELAMVEAIKSELSHITFKEGRPEIEQIITQEIENTDGTLAFVTCGHPKMVDDIRYNVSRNLDKSKYRVEYFEQLQVWG